MSNLYLAVAHAGKPSEKLFIEPQEADVVRNIASARGVKYYRLTLDETTGEPVLSSEVVLAPSRKESVERDVSTLSDDSGDIGDFEV